MSIASTCSQVAGIAAPVGRVKMVPGRKRAGSRLLMALVYMFSSLRPLSLESPLPACSAQQLTLDIATTMG